MTLFKHIKSLSTVIALLVLAVMYTNIALLIIALLFLLIYVIQSELYFLINSQINKGIQLLFTCVLKVMLTLVYYLIIWPFGIIHKMTSKNAKKCKSSYMENEIEYTIDDIVNPW